MKKIAIMAALVFAACEFANANPKDWYSPSGGEKGSVTTKVKVPLSPEAVEIKYKISSGGVLVPVSATDALNEARWVDQDEYALTILASLEEALIARNEVESLAAKLDTSVVTDVEEKDGVISWYKGLSNGQGSSGNRTKSGSATITKYKGDGVHIKLGGDNKTFSLNGNFLANKIYGVTANGFGEVQSDVDSISIEKQVDGKLSIFGWSQGIPSPNFTIAQVLEENLGSENSKVLIRDTVPGQAGYFAQYMKIGRLKKTVDTDNASIQTNDEGKLEVFGYKAAAQGGVPYAGASAIEWTEVGGKGTLLTGSLGKPKWLSSGQSLSLLASSENEDGLEWTYTTSDDKYYGTSHNGTGMGWYTLPNVTTNYIEVDGHTLVEEMKDNGTRKVVKLADAPGVAPNMLYAARMDGVGGTLKWYPFNADIPTNFPTVVDNKSVNTNTSGQVQIYGWETLGSGFLFKNGDHPAISNVISSVVASNGLENISQKLDVVGIQGWQGPACNASIAAMLTTNAADRAMHRVLCRHQTAGGYEMHYAPIGELTGGIGGGTVLKVTGTDGESQTIGSGAVTNELAFERYDSSGLPSVKVEATKDGDNKIILKIGAFYK